ncbi:hypothetical protein WA026_007302 [Henosepilachna vigintioctopunctata]|uniref:Uncharacterized protein n=1 Tax=Henosepilachna vigintioctopunctata TaxID=420089 RepID=A0AAW1UY01_9CUCU
MIFRLKRIIFKLKPCVSRFSINFNSTFAPKVSSGPVGVLTNKYQIGELSRDEIQISACKLLQNVYDEVEKYNAPKKNFISKIISGNSEAPRGLYIYGAVGAGKTMLMDLFYNCCTTNKKARVHFNEFMVEVHKKIHIVKNKFSEQVR